MNTQSTLTSENAPSSSSIPLNIGLTIPLTGTQAQAGREMMLGLEYWKEKVNTAGGFEIGGRAHTINIQYLDNQSNDQNIAEQIKQLITENKVELIISSVENFNTAQEARNALGTTTPIISMLKSLEQEKRLEHISPSYTTLSEVKPSYRAYYNLDLTNTALSALLTGVSIEKILSQQLYFPDGKGMHPGIILFHPSSGITDAEHRWGKFLSNNGYAVYLVDSFTNKGIKDRKTVGWDAAVQAQLDDISEAYYLLSNASSVDPKRIAMLGFSLGGFTVLKAMQPDTRDTNLPINTVASFYGNCALLTNPKLYGNVKILIGDDDDRSLPQPCLDLKRDGAEFAIDVVTYPNAKHGFDNSDLPESLELISETGEVYHLGYDETAHKNAQKDLLEFLNGLMLETK